MVFHSFLCLLVDKACEDESTTAKRIRFTRRSTTPTDLPTTISVNKTAKALTSTTTSSTVTGKNLTSIESSVVTGEPKITVEIVTKKSLHVRNCGERIGDDVPFIAVLVHTNPNEKKSAKQRKTLSKGVLVSENFVLATVSSIYHSEPLWTVSSVRLGDFVTWNKFATRDRSDSMEIEVDEIFYHKRKDLALIKLKHAVPFSDVIRPACLPQSDSYNFKSLQSHMCKRPRNNRGMADVTLESAVSRALSIAHLPVSI
jgi:Trypsin